jgi:hypothetical protein
LFFGKPFYVNFAENLNFFVTFEKVWIIIRLESWKTFSTFPEDPSQMVIRDSFKKPFFEENFFIILINLKIILPVYDSQDK